MNKKIHGFLKGFFTGLFALSLTAGASALLSFEGSAEQNGREWAVVNQEGASVWSNEGGVLTAVGANDDYHKNFYVTDDENALGNYSVSAHFEMPTNTLAGDGEVKTQIGIVPFYKDADNYLMFNLWWRQESWIANVNEILCNVTLEGKQNGQFLNVYNASGSYSPAEYSDVWVHDNSALAAIQKKINVEEGWDITVIKRISDPTFSAPASGDIIEIIVNGVPVGFFTTNLTAPYRAEKHKVGVSMGNAAGLTVTDFNVVDEDMSIYNYPFSAYNYNPLSSSEFVATGNWINESGKLSVNALNDVDDTPTNAVRKLDESYVNYTVSANVKLTETESGAGGAGLTVWHKDHANTLTANLVCENGEYRAEIAGCVNGQTVLATSGTLQITDGALLRAERLGSVLVLYVNGNEAVRATVPFFDNYLVGVNAQAAKAEFTDFSTESKEYTPFDEYSVVLNGVAYTASSNALSDFVSGADGIEVDAGGFAKNAYAVTVRDTYGKTKTSVSVVPNSLGGEYLLGVIGYYENGGKYYYGSVNGSKAEIYSHATSGDVLIASESYVYAGGATTFSMLVEKGKLSFYVGETLAASAQEPSLDPDKGRAGGLIVKGASATFSAPVFDGWRAGDPVTLGEWTAIGPDIDTWSVDANGALTGDAVKTKVERNRAIALKNIEYTSEYYVYGKIFVSEVHSNWEKRAAFYPWYIDENNWIGVFASHVAGNDPEIVAEGKIGGRIVDMKWNAFKGVLALLDTEIVMEVYVGTDQILVYNGKNSQAIWSFDTPGLAAAATGKQVKAGVGVVDVKATFKAFTVSKTLTSQNTVAPTIELITTPAKTGTVGTAVILPVVDVQDDLGESINRVITITDPDGNSVALEGDGRFTPQKAGEYTVRITAKDSWGNEATPYEYKVTVSEKGASGASDKKAGKKGCKSTVFAFPAALIVLGAATVLIKKKKA
ncbi:MAG: hypothetical protein IJY62_03325 [Clostridia bacterium]|nr:hypothetical protein [Clostridia bacterium]